MNRIISYTLAVLSLIVITCALPCNNQAFAQTIQGEEDSIRVEELLLKDTLDLEINGPSKDVTFYMNGMVFLSNTKFHQKMIPDHITFGVVKAYFVPLEYIALESSRPLFINDDFPYSPAGMSFTRDYRQVYFTKAVELYGRRNVEKIFEMSIINGEGTPHNQLSFTDDPSRYMHPSIALDDSYMVFSSDRTPSRGGLDLFISRKTPSGWSEPENMGDNINTSSHEWYPYLDHQNNLYFSSSGHMGFGGYDVFVCYFNGTDWDDPKNLTEYVNTPEDDLGFSINPNKQMAILSRVIDAESKGEVVKINLNDKAFLLSDADETGQRDISLLMKDLVESGYTTGTFPGANEFLSDVIPHPSSAPLLSETETDVTDQEPEPAEQPLPIILLTEEQAPETTQVPETTQASDPEIVTDDPILEVAVAELVVEELEPEPEIDPDKVVFRVQILSSSRPNSSPTVTIEGKKYSTFEYNHKGAYRITVGAFDTVQEASAFRANCKSSGFSQAFVAAFRGNERETDPSVFRK